MKKKMTAKEFKEILNECDLVNSYESCLCTMALYYYNESKKFEQKDDYQRAKWYKDIFIIIGYKLNEHGYIFD